MDISHQNLRNTTWEPYNSMPVGDRLLVHDPFDHTQQLSNYYNLQIHNHNNNHMTSLLPSPRNDFTEDGAEEEEEDLGAIKEMMFKIAAMQPVDIDPATIRRPRRRNIRISDDPQSVAARHRRERISEKIRILKRLVPGGTKMDTASMLDEAIRYVKFLKRQIRILQGGSSGNHLQQPPSVGISTDEYLVTTSEAAEPSYLFDNIDTGAGDEYPVCLNRRFVGDR